MKLFLVALFLGSFFLKIDKAWSQSNKCQSENLIIGKWTNKRVQVQYIVDSHLVHEEEVTAEKGKAYVFDKTTFQVQNPDGSTVQGTYLVIMEYDRIKLVLQLPDNTTTYNLIAVTPTSMVWQIDLDDTYYTQGTTRKSAERAISTEEFTR